MRGIDVSKHNGSINWQEVKKDGIEFAIIRAGYGKRISQKDIRFEENYKGATGVGLHVGAYWYSYAKNGAEALEEAKVFYDVIKGKKFDMPVYLDIEEACCKAYADDIVHNFCGYLESKGYYVGIYASKAYAESYISSINRDSYSMWVAQWADECTYSGKYHMWQYSDKGMVNGIKGNVDVNECNYLIYDVITKNGFNGYGEFAEQEKKRRLQVMIDGKELYSTEI